MLDIFLSRAGTAYNIHQNNNCESNNSVSLFHILSSLLIQIEEERIESFRSQCMLSIYKPCRKCLVPSLRLILQERHIFCSQLCVLVDNFGMIRKCTHHSWLCKKKNLHSIYYKNKIDTVMLGFCFLEIQVGNPTKRKRIKSGVIVVLVVIVVKHTN